MKKHRYRWLPFLLAGCVSVCLFITACKSSNERTKQIEKVSPKEDLIRNQQNIMRNESEDIDAYVSRLNIPVTKTQTGLRYHIYENGKGTRKPVTEDIVKVKYTVSLLDGSLVYSSDSTGAIEFQLGKSDVANGFQEGLALMNEGDKSIFILPSHLAYGLTGDGDKIKHYEALVIDAELLEIKPAK